VSGPGHPADPRYPIGRFEYAGEADDGRRREWIDQIAALPAEFRAAVRAAGPKRLDTPYRPGGWTVRQVVHHVPDSHMNAFIRFKLALTEPEPTIKPYDETLWADLGDVRGTPVDVSLTLLDALHERWVVLLRSLAAADFQRTFIHPEQGRAVTLDRTLALYAWHGQHHTGHVRQAVS
jgi:uncharacterized damage-inducible protein DinB